MFALGRTARTRRHAGAVGSRAGSAATYTFSGLCCAELVASILKEGGLLEASSNPGSATPEMLHRIYQGRAAVTANPYLLRDINATSSLSFCSTMGLGNHNGGGSDGPSPVGSPLAQCHQRGGASASTSASASTTTTIGGVSAQERAAERESLLQHRAIMAPVPPPARSMATAAVLGERRRADSPPRGHFRVITHVGASGSGGASGRPVVVPSGGGSSGHTGCAVRAAAAAAAAAATGPRSGLQLTLRSLDMRGGGAGAS